MALKYVRIAELTENIETLNQQIALHQQSTKNISTIQQYKFKRGEFIEELQELLKPMQLTLKISETTSKRA